VVLWALVVIEGRRAGVKHLWAPIAANLAVGVSLGLPLFLYMREERLERSTGPACVPGFDPTLPTNKRSQPTAAGATMSRCG